MYRTPYSETAAAAAEPEFPSELRAPPSPLRVAAAAAGGGSWWKPTTLAELLLLRQAYPAARIVVGNTEVGIESRYKGRATDSFLCPTAVAELTACADGDDGMTLGAAASLADVEKLCGGAAAARPGRRGEVARAVMAMLRWFASTQIRNAACLGGNLVTASPISDMNPMLAACGATLRVASAARGDRTVAVASFFKAYRTVDLAADEIVVSVHVPHAHEDAFVRPFKQARRREDASAPPLPPVPALTPASPTPQARRREDDISIVTAGIHVRLTPTDGAWKVARRRSPSAGWRRRSCSRRSRRRRSWDSRGMRRRWAPRAPR